MRKPENLIPTPSFLSIWEISSRWAGYQPEQIDELSIPPTVLDSIRLLLSAQIDTELEIISLNGFVVTSEKHQVNPFNTIGFGHPDGLTPLDLELEWTESAILDTHQYCLNEKDFRKKYLDSICVDKYELGSLLAQKRLELPEFWFSNEDKQKLKKNLSDWKEEESSHSAKLNQIEIDSFWGKLSNAQRSRLMARQTAKELWRRNPLLTIAEIERHDFIQKICGAAHFSDKDTVRNWIKDLDPRPPEAKKGRPKKQ